MTDSILRERFNRMQQAFRQEPYPSLDHRRDRLNRLLQLLKKHQKEIAEAIDEDFGQRSTTETSIVDLYPSIEEIRHTRSQLRRWMKVRKVSVPLSLKPGRAKILPQPLGVVGIIVPWNYPIFLLFGPLCNALAAGNVCMIKPSEFTPAYGALMSRLFAEYFSSDEVAIIEGGVDVAEAFSRLPFNHLLFTGSTAVGKKVMKAAAEHLTPVTLELGGKSPAIVSEHFSLKTAANRLISTKLTNAGQTCIAPDYVLIPFGQEKAFLTEAKKVAASRYPDWPGKDYCQIIDERQRQRIMDILADAEKKGAEVIKLIDAEDSERFVVPRIVFNSHDQMRLMQEELFAPILPVLSYRAMIDAIQYINDRPRPLALYLFSDHEQEQWQVLQETHAGGVTINDCLVHCGVSALPFGGIGPSGIGQYHGEAGFNTFSHLKSVFKQSSLSGVPMMYPPYNGLTRWLVKLLIR
ncbi:coniferyl aldehyde dehydrogenase [Permianibacter aggregans]|uniref:Aldehyde dehydrogenase n=1 Tax=Permianibacter aggregans TaxID=1510150 RepID=A0A4R6UT21_9GAMM|nr:coniferyl aldehyde dehydrogenase [Permianibacter aggregans]QGX40444.1 coniferyl aldehyde dehydrogenase [Permianibacter aggregans]TDQ49416.1 aldehyde dehydrogenase (NAD+)/coniferyl-aldehyde dehydrogenase [Permianibacter aggregans]